jgi:myo-inositol-1(or 4)-monophosphatase
LSIYRSDPFRSYLDFTLHTAQEAGQISLKYYQTGLQPDFKKDASPVTIADRETEEFIRGRIEQVYPGHAIVGEEFGESTSRGEPFRWIIDPIDGTRAFVRGVPLYGVLIGLEIEGVCRVGVAHFPALQETVHAASGSGCWWNGQPAHVSTVPRLDQALLAHADTASFARCGKGPAWERLQQATQFRAGWGDCYGYLLVATGRAEVMVDPIMNVWDCGPFPVILEEAGGYFGDWKGNVTMIAGEALATTQTLLPQVLGVLQPGE